MIIPIQADAKCVSKSIYNDYSYPPVFKRCIVTTELETITCDASIGRRNCTFICNKLNQLPTSCISRPIQKQLQSKPLGVSEVARIIELKEFVSDTLKHQVEPNCSEGTVASIGNVTLLEKEAENYRIPVNYERCKKSQHTAEECAGLWLYTNSWYQSLNSALRSENGAESDLEKHFERSLNSALDKISNPYKGWTHRGVNVSKEELPEILKRYQPGSEVTERGFTSTSWVKVSSSEEVFTSAKHFVARNVRFAIKSNCGKSVDAFSFDGEDEILFASGTTFQVESVKLTEEGALITMKELKSPLKNCL